MMFHIGKDDWYQWMDTLFTNFDRCACDDFVEFMFQEVTGNHLNLYRLSLLCVCLYCACVLTVCVSLLCVCTYYACALTVLQSSWTFKLHYLIFLIFLLQMRCDSPRSYSRTESNTYVPIGQQQGCRYRTILLKNAMLQFEGTMQESNHIVEYNSSQTFDRYGRTSYDDCDY